MAKKPAIQMTNGIDDIIKGGKKLLYRAVDAMPKSRYRKQVKTAKKYAKERVVIQSKYDKQLAADKGAQRAIKYAEIDAIIKKKTATRRAGGSKF
jgi:hypothetical protein